jgi:N6-L-threonylcarbamoyladenine synthase
VNRKDAKTQRKHCALLRAQFPLRLCAFAVFFHVSAPPREPFAARRSTISDFQRICFVLQAGMEISTRLFTVLGIETSCDETAAAVARGAPPGPGEILSNIVFSQIEEHRPYGGVVPEIAARAHVEILDGVIEEALAGAGLVLGDIDAVAATAGPGLIGGVMVGLVTAKALALAASKPLIGNNHLEAHALTTRLTDGTPFPFLLLLVSGGHCQLLAVEEAGVFRLYGTSIDDAAGEAFDKTAKLLGLAYPGGPALEELAKRGDPGSLALPRPMFGRENCDFSFAGLKTAVRQLVRSNRALRPEDVAASFQQAVVDVMRDRARHAMRRFRRELEPDQRRLVVAGGVAANMAIRSALSALAGEEGFIVTIPPPRLCTDNAAMIAWAGIEKCAASLFDSLSLEARARWPLAAATQR